MRVCSSQLLCTNYCINLNTKQFPGLLVIAEMFRETVGEVDESFDRLTRPRVPVVGEQLLTQDVSYLVGQVHDRPRKEITYTLPWNAHLSHDFD